MLVPVLARDVRHEWDWVRAGLLKVVEKTGDDWMPEDIYHEIKAGVSGLFVLEHGGERIGFIVLQLWPAYHSGPRMFVRAIWCRPFDAYRHRHEIMADLREYAATHGVVAIRMTSPRGWDGADIGFEAKQTIYEVAL